MTTLISTSQPPTAINRSGMFIAPGRPRPLARRLAIHNYALRRMRQFLEENGFLEIPVNGLNVRQQLTTMLDKGFPAVWCESQVFDPGELAVDRCLPRFKLITVLSTTGDLDGLCKLMVNLLKDVTCTLGAELLGGRQVTRLDRTVRLQHPELTHPEAVAIAQSRGWEIGAKDDLSPSVEATLVRHCGNLPVLITQWPAHLKPGLKEIKPGRSARVKYLVPYAGEVMDGGMWQGEESRAGFGLGVGRLLQYLMGLGSITHTTIVPESGSGLSRAQAAE